MNILTIGDLFLTYLQNQTGLTIITSMILILLTGFFIGLILFYILKITPLREMSEINYLFSLCVGLFSMLFVIKILETFTKKYPKFKSRKEDKKAYVEEIIWKIRKY